MTWQKGQSGNPAGRKPGERALTTILEDYGRRAVGAVGEREAAKRRLASLVWQGATEGRVHFSDRVVHLSGRGWSDLVQWLYTHIDGSAPTKLEHSSDPDRPLTIRVEYDDGDLGAQASADLAATATTLLTVPNGAGGEAV